MPTTIYHQVIRSLSIEKTHSNPNLLQIAFLASPSSLAFFKKLLDQQDKHA